MQRITAGPPDDASMTAEPVAGFVTEEPLNEPAREVITGTAVISGPTFVNRTVTYEEIDGMAVFEGDIILGPVEKVRAAAEARKAATVDAVDVPFGMGTIALGSRWPHAEVPYDDSSLPPAIREWAVSARAHWEQHTPITFVKRTAFNAEDYPNYVRFRPIAGTVSYSDIGMQGGRQDILLSPGSHVGIAIHEIGHAVGLWHEHSRADRDTFVTIHPENIQPGKEINFAKDDKGTSVVLGAYDYGSIMHYRRTEFSNIGLDTIVPTDPNAQIGQRIALSAGDISAVKAMYSPKAEPIRVPIGPRAWNGDTSWAGGFGFTDLGSSFGYAGGRGIGHFSYDFVLPSYAPEQRLAGISAVVASGQDGRESDVALVVNGERQDTYRVQARSAGSDGVRYEWVFPEHLLRPGQQNTIAFKVFEDAAMPNGVSLFARTIGAASVTAIEVVVPYAVAVAPGPDPYEAEFLEQQVPSLMIAGRTYPVWVKMYNINDRVWRSGRVWLRSEQPTDNTRWGTNRVDLPGGANLPGHSDAKFEFTVKAPEQLGPTLFRWGMAAAGHGSFGAKSKAVSVMVARDALFVAQSVPALIVAGTTMQAAVTFRNIGSDTWTRGADVHLRGHGPAIWGMSRVELPHDVAPGADVTFRFPITAPATAAKADLQCRLYRGAATLGAPSDAFEVRVMPPLPKAAHFISQSVPSAMATSTTYKTTVTLRNAGTTTWTAAAGFKLGSKSPDDNVRWGMNRVELPHDVPPNAEVTFAFNVRTRAAAQTMAFQWQMLQEGQGRFGQITPNVDVRVAVSTWQAAFQAYGGNLWLTGADNRGSMGLGMAAGTSPSIAALRAGGWVTAFQANTGELWVVGPNISRPGGLGMKPGTSPSIAALPAGGWVAAFQATGGDLWVVGTGGPGAMKLGMAPGTSPSIAALSTGGWVVAFQANTGELWVVGPNISRPGGLGMKPGTSPSIAALPAGGWVAAFQATGGDLWVVGTGGPGAMKLGMAPGTSPSIAALTTSGWETAFQANTGELWVVGADNRGGSLGHGMKAGTSPAIAAQPKGRWQAAFHGRDGRLWSVGAESRGATDLGMAPGTSPAIAQFPWR